MNPHDFPHLDALHVQALLDGDLAAEVEAGVRAHLAGCAECRAEVAAWQEIFSGLADLPDLAPTPGFATRVMARLDAGPLGNEGAVTPTQDLVPMHASGPAQAATPARAAPPIRGDHVPAGRLQDFAEGLLAARIATRIAAHLEGCPQCRAELAAFSQLNGMLASLPALVPPVDFAESVMAGLRVRQAARLAMAVEPRPSRAAAVVRALVPTGRKQRWATALGLGLAPALAVILVVRAIFAHPLVTLGNLASYASMQLQDAGTIAADLLSRPMIVDALDAAREMVGSPARLTGLMALLSALTVAAVWTLYRFLLPASQARTSHASAHH